MVMPSGSLRAASQPMPLPLAAQFAVGQRVEAAQTDEGMLGAWFSGRILEIKPGVGSLSGKANVEMDELDEADGGGKPGAGRKPRAGKPRAELY